MQTAEKAGTAGEPPRGVIARLLESPLEPRIVEERSARFPRTASEWKRFGLVVVQLALAVLVIERFQIESRAFARLFSFACVGFVVHALLPARFRLLFFALLSMAGIAVVLGPDASQTVVLLGLTMIALCHVPGPAWVPAGLILGAGVLFAVMRADLLSAPWSSVVWPILGSMFMFRVILFLYDRSHGEKSRSIWETLSYFFLLPNVCFPFFPVVDYKTFRRTYYGEEAWRCAQTGVRWITRGLAHLLLYRFVYYYGVLAPTEVASGGDLFRYAFANFALYLRVAGNFHVIVGMLRLFGFGLPETNFLFFIADGINDWWRRTNIYWKDFMLKVFYMPTFFKLRKKGEDRAIVQATLLVVLATWFLHSYQSFWLTGTFILRWQDGVFWTIFAVAMVATAIYENRHTSARGLHTRDKGAWDWLPRFLRVLVTFSLICLLWTFWTCDSFGVWLDAVTLSNEGPPATSPGGVLLTVLLFVGILAVGSVMSGRSRGAAGSRGHTFARDAVISFATLAFVLVVSVRAVHARLGETASEVVQSLQSQKLNRLDAVRLQRGYYEDMMTADHNSELAMLFQSKPQGWVELHETKAMRPDPSFRLTRLGASLELVYKEALLQTNEWGMRDRPYTKEKPAGTHRTILVGGSLVMGSGVENDETFEALLEVRLNEERPLGQETSFEILNLAVGGYSPVQRVLSFEEAVDDFTPDALIYVAHENETYRLFRHLSGAHERGFDPTWPGLAEIYREAGIQRDTATDVFEARLTPRAEDVLRVTYARAVELCRERGIRPVWILLPTLELQGVAKDDSWLSRLALETGFEVIELFGVYDGYDPNRLRIAAWDYHPSVLGHRLIAERLHAELTAPGALYGRDE